MSTKLPVCSTCNGTGCLVQSCADRTWDSECSSPTRRVAHRGHYIPCPACGSPGRLILSAEVQQRMREDIEHTIVMVMAERGWTREHTLRVMIQLLRQNMGLGPDDPDPVPPAMAAALDVKKENNG